MQARFIGDPANDGEGPHSLSLFGVDFIKGEWTEVPPPFEAKIRGNRHFEIDVDGDDEPEPDIDALRAALDLKGVSYHPRAGVGKLKALLAEQEG